MENSKSKASNTGYKGIYFRKDRGKFEATLTLNNGIRAHQKHFHIGYFDTLNEAKKEREEYIKNLF